MNVEKTTSLAKFAPKTQSWETAQNHAKKQNKKQSKVWETAQFKDQNDRKFKKVAAQESAQDHARKKKKIIGKCTRL